ncbi:MAG: right-handed parallel beta-helix repeat-containing protein [Candidatus Hadarchaeales archaeon]
MLAYTSNSFIENNVAKNGYFGIYLQNSDNNTISSNTMENNCYGIYLASSDNNTISGNTMKSNFWTGIFLGSSDNNTIVNNVIENTRGAFAIGIYLKGSDNNFLDNNSVINNTLGIMVFYSENNVLRNNRAENNHWNFGVVSMAGGSGYYPHYIHDIDNSNLVNGKPVIYILGKNNITVNQDNVFGYLGLVGCENVIVENLVLENNFSGLLLAGVKNGRVENISARYNWIGIALDTRSDHNTISGNTMENNYYGIYLGSSDNNNISGNTMENNYYGIYLGSSDNNNISGNTIDNSQYGISLLNSDNNTISGNTVENNYTGIYLSSITYVNGGIREENSDNNTVLGNTLKNNNYGIYLQYAHYNTISSNTFQSNLWYDIYLPSNATNNVFEANLMEHAYGIPWISNVQSSPSQTSATITWTTSKASTSVVEYGPTTAYGYTATDGVTTSHSVSLSGLSAGTTYHYRVKSMDADNNLEIYFDNTFTTSSPSGDGVTKTNTTLTIAPSSFSLTSGSSIILAATLKDVNGNLLPGKTVRWIAAKGSISPTIGTTNNSGEVIAIYTAPTVTAPENVTITASFAGDGSYYGSTATSICTVFPAPRASSSLSITPSSFTIRSDENKILTATLLSERGAPMAGKIISWSTTAGSITPASTTDNLGRATATFKAPSVTALTTVTITALFGGDASFAASQAGSIATVKPPPAKAVLSLRPENLRITAGSVVEVVASISTEDGTPLSSKMIGWSTTAGRIEARSRATDAVGEVWAKFYAPDAVENELPVTITASFAGDEDYLQTQNTLLAAVVPKTLPATSIAVTPASFNIAPGGTIGLTAKLTSGGTALAGKPTQWSVNIGEIIIHTSVTDDRGEARATYRAPENLDTNTPVTVTVAFLGDAGYGPSVGVSRGAVLLPEVKQTLDNLQTATQEIVDIQAIEENLVFLRDAVIRGDVAAAVKIGKAAELSESRYVHENAKVRVKEVRERRVDVEVESDRGRTILLNVEDEIIPVLSEEIEVRVDNVKIEMADDYADVLDPANDENACEYFILKGANGIQLLVSIPSFSSRTVTIGTMPTVPLAGILSPYLMIGAVVVILVLVLLIIWRYTRAGMKKLPEIQAGAETGQGKGSPDADW